MKFEYSEEANITDVLVDKNDCCFLCANFYVCPLIGAIETHSVYPACEELGIDECAMYEPEGLAG